jgi:hypothetical protein
MASNSILIIYYQLRLLLSIINPKAFIKFLIKYNFRYKWW